MKRALLLWVPLCCACGRGPAAKRVVSPSGHYAYAVSCKRATDCLELAGESCPMGYVVLDRASDTEARGFANVSQGSGVAFSKVETTGTLLIECNPRTCATDANIWRACEAKGGTCKIQKTGEPTCDESAVAAPVERKTPVERDAAPPAESAEP